MNFADWIIREMAWKLGEDSLKSYRNWKQFVKADSNFMRVPWKKAKPFMDKIGPDRYYEMIRKQFKIPPDVPTERFEEYAVREFIKDKSDVLLARVDPCKLMALRSTEVSSPDLTDKYYIKMMEKDVDPNLPLLFINLNGVNLYDGNHRMASACELGQDGYVAIAYFLSYDPVKSAIKEIVEQ